MYSNVMHSKFEQTTSEAISTNENSSIYWIKKSEAEIGLVPEIKARSYLESVSFKKWQY